MVTIEDVLAVFPGAQVVDPKDVARSRKNLAGGTKRGRERFPRQQQDRKASTATADADRKARIERALKAGVRRQQAQQGRLFE